MAEAPFTAVHKAVFDHLDYLDALVGEGDLRCRAALADSEIARLTAAWRALLDQHALDGRGRCRQCSGQLRARRSPCTVWTTAHQHLVTDGPPTAATGRHAAVDRRSSVAVLGAS
ncbi:hypothetical protein ACIQMJ_40535 [Actinosynnema sp. NPDC091369]